MFLLLDTLAIIFVGVKVNLDKPRVLLEGDLVDR
jgi:hypothetical protein